MTDLETPFDPKRPRFYLLDMDLRAEPDFDFTNEDVALIEQRTAGTHVVQVRDTGYEYHIGVPTLAAKPEIVVGSRTRGKRPLDLYRGNGMFLSDRFKRLLDAIDPDAFEVAECLAFAPSGKPIDPYWWFDVVRVLDAVDEERSELSRLVDNPFSSKSAINEILYFKLQDIRMRPEVVGSAHLFRLAPARSDIIVDQVVADAIRAEALFGVRLTPLQPPSPDERKNHFYFGNYPYWTDKGYT
ncbi:imm11 family protein [Sphingomonas qilianensis]|uniref:DUF1629 domain-containing protein n=1 Tax=Sphingomonas qilianensis TaxID=1736690 RepID=A0ABU9XUJ2_9SPHN